MSQYSSHTLEKAKDLYETPVYIYNWLDSKFNFKVDLAANAENRRSLWWFSLDEHDEGLGNALTSEWAANFNGGTGYCNPPYSNIKPWIKKAIKEAQTGFTTVMLIETPNGQSHYKEAFEHASSVIFINGRVSFIASHDFEKMKRSGEIEYTKKGEPVTGNTRGSCVFVFQPHFGDIKLSNVNRDDLIRDFGGKL